jgi:P pilus assembly chaperone PapD
MVRKENNRYLFWITAILIIALSCPAFSQPQHIYVQPLIIEIGPYPGTTVETHLEITNSTDEPQLVQFDLHSLTQSKNAGWQIIKPELDNKSDIEQSCESWITLSEPNITIGPYKRTAIKVKLKVPPKAKGFNLAGITATLTPTQAPGAVGIIVRFLVPILVQIRAQALRENVAASDVGITFREESSRLPASTLVSMNVANKGKAYSKIKGSVLVKKRVGMNWRRITEAAFEERKIIPGVEVQLETDIERSLPSGRYLLRGQLYVGGRRAKPLEKEIDFTGDPTVTQTATDAAIEVEPGHISIETEPGATRMMVILVTNASNTEVNINAQPVIPPNLKSVALGELRGETLACQQWIKVTPDNFKLRPNMRQNIRIIATMPNSKLPFANYYASLDLRASYGNGQSAGKKNALVCVHNKNLKSEPLSQAMGLTITAEKASRNIIRATFGNVGNVHFNPKCSATISNEQRKIKAKLSLKGDTSAMFPLELREFSEVVDFSGFEAGTYYVEVFLDYGTGQVARGIMPIRVYVEGIQKIVEIVKPEQRAIM